MSLISKNYSPEEVLAEVERQKYKLIWLENLYGDIFKSANSPSIKPSEQVKKIFDLLNSDMVPNGRYIVKGKTSTKDKGLPGQMPVLKGSISEVERVAPPQLMAFENNEVKVNVASYLETYAQNAKLQAENEMMKNQRASLQARIERLEEELAELKEDTRGLAEASAPGFDLSQLAPFIPLVTELFKKPEPPPDPERLAIRKAFQGMAENQKALAEELKNLRAQLEPEEEEEEEEEEMNFETVEELHSFILANHGPEALETYKRQNPN